MPARSAVILVPGLLCSERLWEKQIAGLSDYADISVADLTMGSTISEMASTILETAPPRFSLAGFSLGGQVALEIMRVSGERVDRLALLSTTHGGLLPEVGVAVRNAMAAIELNGLGLYLDAVFPSYVTSAHAQDVEMKGIFLEMGNEVGEAAGLRQMQALLAIAGPILDFEKIRCRTMIIGGRQDRRTTPAAHEVLAKEIAGSELIFIDGAAHFTVLEQPAAVTDALRRWIQ